MTIDLGNIPAGYLRKDWTGEYTIPVTPNIEPQRLRAIINATKNRVRTGGALPNRGITNLRFKVRFRDAHATPGTRLLVVEYRAEGTRQ